MVTDRPTYVLLGFGIGGGGCGFGGVFGWLPLCSGGNGLGLGLSVIDALLLTVFTALKELNIGDAFL